MMLRLGSGGSVTELSVTGRLRDGAVIKPACSFEFRDAGQYGSLQKQFTEDHRRRAAIGSRATGSFAKGGISLARASRARAVAL
jgi:hypothetical protein